MIKEFYSILLLAALGFSLVMLNPLEVAYAHTFSSDESASFLALVEQIKIETHLAYNNTSQASIALQHAVYASELLNANVTKEIIERNNRIGTDLPVALKGLEGLLASSEPDAQTIKDKVKQIDNLLGEAVSVRIDSHQLTNSTVNALSFALLINTLVDHYYKAIPTKITTNATEGFLEPVEKTTGSGSYKVQASWNPPEIEANRTNTYMLKFFDGHTNQPLSGTTIYAFMFMPASDSEVMIIHRQPEKATDGQDKQSFMFQEKHVGPTTMRISWINGYEREAVDFPITVLPPANNSSSSPPTSSGSNSDTDKPIANMTEYQTAQALANRLNDLFRELKNSAPANSTATVSQIEDGLEKLKVAVDGKVPIDNVEILVHGQIHPNLQKLYDLHVIPEFPLTLLVVVSAVASAIVAARLGPFTVTKR